MSDGGSPAQDNDSERQAAADVAANTPCVLSLGACRQGREDGSSLCNYSVAKKLDPMLTHAPALA